jgi:hypothetical protein
LYLCVTTRVVALRKDVHGGTNVLCKLVRKWMREGKKKKKERKKGHDKTFYQR